jgi:glucose/arabinose dehydrogenase
MRIGPQRPVNPDAIVAPQGYRVEALITGLSFPSAISFGPGGELYLAESGGVAGQLVSPPRVLRIDPDRSVNEIGRLDNPIVGLVYRNGELFIAEDSSLPRILRVTAEAEIQILVEGLPGGGDYGLSGLSLDAQGALLFGLGTRTNSGVVGLDNLARGWVARQPDAADVPGADVELAGVNYVTSLPTLRGSSRHTTGGLRPFGMRSEAGQSIKGAARCGGAVYRIGLDAGEPERIAWGLRNPVGVSCGPDGRIFATEGGMEERGSRPVAAAPDNLWEIQANGYYGWPDHASGIAVTDARFRLPGHPAPRKLLSRGPAVTTVPLATFAARSGVGRLDFSTSTAFGFAGEALVALSGEWCLPAFAGDDASHGCRVVRVDPRTGNIVDFLVNRNPLPSSTANSGGLERPFDVRFDPSGEVLYVVDMGEVHLHREHGMSPYGGTGVVWRITRIRPMANVPAPRRRGGAEEAPDVHEAGAEFEAGADELTAEEDEAVVEEALGSTLDEEMEGEEEAASNDAHPTDEASEPETPAGAEAEAPIEAGLSEAAEAGADAPSTSEVDEPEEAPAAGAPEPEADEESGAGEAPAGEAPGNGEGAAEPETSAAEASPEAEPPAEAGSPAPDEAGAAAGSTEEPQSAAASSEETTHPGEAPE